MLLSRIIVFILLGLLAAVYFLLAKKFQIVDKPNHRSSHVHNTVRGGGILIPVAVLLWWFVYDFNHTWMILGLLWISSISFLDDLYEISKKLRFGVQFLAITMCFYDLDLFDFFPVYSIPVFYFIALGIINAVNFMDGINGITGLYGIVFFGTFLVLDSKMDLIDPSLIHYILMALCVFLLFNLRKNALMFAGDIGSISMAYMMIFLMTKWYITTQSWTIILLLMIYGLDVFLTMIQRFRRGERILEPHRSHLYQRLVNERKVPHILIAIIFAFIQGVINYILFVSRENSLPEPFYAALILIVFGLCYYPIKYQVEKEYIR